MSLNVQNVIEDCDASLAKEIKADVDYVRIKTGIDVTRGRVKSVGEMGDAKGTCVIETKEFGFRVDNFAANNAEHYKQERGQTGSFRHVARHEAEHAKGNRLEGTTELVASKELRVDPVPAYREKVRAAKAIVTILGWDKTMENARQENAEGLLFTALVQQQVANNVDFFEAAEQAQELVEAAA
jgi:hypothetical protein